MFLFIILSRGFQTIVWAKKRTRIDEPLCDWHALAYWNADFEEDGPSFTRV